MAKAGEITGVTRTVFYRLVATEHPKGFIAMIRDSADGEPWQLDVGAPPFPDENAAITRVQDFADTGN